MAPLEFGFLSDLLGFRLKQATEVLLSESEKLLQPLGISPQQFSILAMVSLNPGIIQTRLIKNLYITRSNCSVLIEQLIKMGLMKRAPIDRRSNGLSLTTQGIQIMAEAKGIVEAHGKNATAHMNEAEIADLIRLLTKFSEADQEG